jgi:hypothetical protein
MKQRSEDLRPECDLASLKGRVRGEYCQRALAGTNLVLLELDVGRAFPDSESVNRTLRSPRDVATKSLRPDPEDGQRAPSSNGLECPESQRC